MKNKTLFTIIFLSIIILVLALAQTTTPDVGGDVQKITDAVDKIPIDKDTGKVDPSKILAFKTKAEVRIDKINAWLEKQVAWFNVILGINPVISWLFFVNLYIWLLALTHLIINITLYLPFENKLISRGIGIVSFIILLVTKAYFHLAVFLIAAAKGIWNTILPTTIWASVIGFIIILVLAITFPQVSALLTRLITTYLQKRAERKAKLKEIQNREVLDAMVGGIRGK